MAASSSDAINLLVSSTRTSQPDDSCGYLENLPSELFAAISNFLPNTRDKAALSQTCSHFYSFFQPELNNKGLHKLLKAIIDDDRATVKKLLENNPRLLLEVPPQEMVIESQYTSQTFYAEQALTMAAKRKQIEMIKILLFYFHKLPETEEVNHARSEGLKAWAPYEIRPTAQEMNEIVIPREYKLLAQFLVDTFREETFPHGAEINGTLSERTEAARASIRSILRPGKPIMLDNAINPELFLLALYNAYNANFNQFQNQKQRDAFCISSIGLTQHILSPEVAKVICEGLYYVVEKKQAISARATSLKLYGGADFYRGASEFQPNWRSRDYLCVCGWEIHKGCWCDSRAEGWHNYYQNFCQTRDTEFSQIVRSLPQPPSYIDEPVPWSLCAIS